MPAGKSPMKTLGQRVKEKYVHINANLVQSSRDVLHKCQFEKFCDCNVNKKNTENIHNYCTATAQNICGWLVLLRSLHYTESKLVALSAQAYSEIC